MPLIGYFAGWFERLLKTARDWKASARTRADRDAALDALFENGAAGIAEVDLRTELFVRVNRRFCEILRRGEAELLTTGPLAVIHPEDAAFVREQGMAALLGSGEESAEVRHLCGDGAVIWCRVGSSISKRDDQGAPLRSISVVHDITESVVARERLRASETTLRLGMEIGQIGAFRRDLRRDWAFEAGPEMRRLHGFPVDEAPIPFERWFATFLPEDLVRIESESRRALNERKTEISFHYRLRRANDGALRHMEARARYEYDNAGQPLSSNGVVIDVTNLKEAQDNLAHAARHDALTGLPNRVLFGERMNEALARSRRGEQFAVLCLDLDRFKDVNDTLGHSFGDQLLREATARLQAEMREFDTLARLGGDEFAIIQSNLEDRADASILARRLIESLSEPFLIDGHQVVVGVSVGIAVTPGDGAQKDELLKAADMALYQAKSEGRGCWRYFKPEMNARVQERRVLELELRRAFAQNEFELFYQPILDVATRRVKSLEALIRWRHPERGLVAPDAFIPLCEDIGLIVSLGAWVLRRACQDAMSWPGRLSVAVNLSAVQFLTGDLVAAVALALDESGLSPDRLELEITETVMLQNTEATLALLHGLKQLGLRISMDDFGTGDSSLSYLQRFPFDKVKIDRSFTRNLGCSRQSNAIVQAVADLCSGLDMTMIAEGVETEQQFQSLIDKGCSEAQGFLFGAPCPLSEVAQLIQRLGYQGEICCAAE